MRSRRVSPNPRNPQNVPLANMGTAAKALDPMRAGKERSPSSGSLLTSTTRAGQLGAGHQSAPGPPAAKECRPGFGGSSSATSARCLPHEAEYMRGEPSGSSTRSTTHARAASAPVPAGEHARVRGHGPGSSMRAAPKATASRMRSRRSRSDSIRLLSVTSWRVTQYPCRRPPVTRPRRSRSSSAWIRPTARGPGRHGPADTRRPRNER